MSRVQGEKLHYPRPPSSENKICEQQWNVERGHHDGDEWGRRAVTPQFETRSRESSKVVMKACNRTTVRFPVGGAIFPTFRIVCPGASGLRVTVPAMGTGSCISRVSR